MLFLFKSLCLSLLVQICVYISTNICIFVFVCVYIICMYYQYIYIYTYYLIELKDSRSLLGYMEQQFLGASMPSPYIAGLKRGSSTKYLFKNMNSFVMNIKNIEYYKMSGNRNQTKPRSLNSPYFFLFVILMWKCPQRLRCWRWEIYERPLSTSPRPPI